MFTGSTARWRIRTACMPAPLPSRRQWRARSRRRWTDWTRQTATSRPLASTCKKRGTTLPASAEKWAWNQSSQREDTSSWQTGASWLTRLISAGQSHLLFYLFTYATSSLPCNSLQWIRNAKYHRQYYKGEDGFKVSILAIAS